MGLESENMIKLVIVDVDGVLTDGGIWYSDSGQECKAFHIQDGLGLKRLQKMGIKIAIISGRNSPSVICRMKELNIIHIFQSISDKLEIFDQLLKKFNITPDNVASIGDDLPDIPIMQASKIAIAVNNAVPEVKAIAHYCTSRSGGEGAVREACEWILNQSVKRYEAKNTTS